MNQKNMKSQDINKILHGLDYLKENMDAYFGEAAKQGLTEEDAKNTFLKGYQKLHFTDSKAPLETGAQYFYL